MSFLALHVLTTADEHGVYVTKDKAETIELAWVLVDSAYHEVASDSVVVRPASTPVTPLCTSATGLSWEDVADGELFKQAVARLDAFVSSRCLPQEVTIVLFNAWDVKVQLPREAFDKLVVLPVYLQHPRCLDLSKAFAKWQQLHPEALSYSPALVVHMCVALDVEMAQLETKLLQPQLPFHLQLLASAVARRAGAEATTAARVFAALARSSPLYVATPHDGQADIKAFVLERLKVLFLSNLGLDTTQLELELWFAQHGKRPLAFWTLRTPDKPCGSGFAVFHQHEGAAELLTMNGRLLNERCVEVQPLSLLVLDRAQEILTPFPLLKNRPRPGDWNCPLCGFLNFQRRTSCFRCLFAATLAAQINDNMYGGYGSRLVPPSLASPLQRGSGKQNPVPFRAGDWKCTSENCQYHNFAKNMTCLKCGGPRAQPMMGVQQQPRQGDYYGHYAQHKQFQQLHYYPQDHRTQLPIDMASLSQQLSVLPLGAAAATAGYRLGADGGR